MTARPRLLFYCQHSVGLGHLVRSLALCRSLAERFEVVLLCGGSVPEAIEMPPGVRVIALPPLGVSAEGTFGSHDPSLTVERARRLRRELLITALLEVRPDVLLIELFPFGRAKFARELEPLLAEARGMGLRRPLVACSLRDILVRKRSDQESFDDLAAQRANRWFDAILVHADPRLAPLEESFKPRTPLAVPVHYTGYVVPNGHREVAPGPREDRIVVSAGGGLVGEPLMHAALGAHRLLWPSTRLRTTLIAGPFLPQAAYDELCVRAQGVEGLEVLRAVPDLGDHLRTARASISQGGYNTTLELLREKIPALVVPYAPPEEDEQIRRATRLQGLGALRTLAPERLSAEALAAEIPALLDFQPRALGLEADGAERTSELLELLAAERLQPAVARGVAT
jgi:predicted glycosyltransferase